MSAQLSESLRKNFDFDSLCDEWRARKHDRDGHYITSNQVDSNNDTEGDLNCFCSCGYALVLRCYFEIGIQQRNQ